VKRSAIIETPLERDREREIANGQDETVANAPHPLNEEGHEDGTVSELPEDPQAEIERLQLEVEENLGNYQRAVADLANYRRRKEQETRRLIDQSRNEMLRRILPIVDDLDRALASVEVGTQESSWLEGFRLIAQKLWATLESEGVRPMDSVGRPFDPNLHDALLADENAAVKDTVVEEYERGYYIRDEVLRPAKVKVGSAEALQPSDD
jgi:molecular chaperone GrpE